MVNKIIILYSSNFLGGPVFSRAVPSNIHLVYLNLVKWNEDIGTFLEFCFIVQSPTYYVYMYVRVCVYVCVYVYVYMCLYIYYIWM